LQASELIQDMYVEELILAECKPQTPTLFIIWICFLPAQRLAQMPVI